MLFVNRVLCGFVDKADYFESDHQIIWQIGVDALVNLKAKAQRNLEQEVCAKIAIQ